MTNYLIVPGLGNSGPEHWQTFFEKSGGNFHRIEQQEWDSPQCSNWIETIDKALAVYDLDTVVIVAHSLGCAATAHWAQQYNKKIKGAMLVAPSDVDAVQYTFPAKGFSPMPLAIINFPTIVVASTNDQWVTLERAAFFADKWNSSLVSIGDAGHINALSGHHHWQQGLEILKTLG